MNKDVNVTVTGKHISDGQTDYLKTAAKGIYHNRNGKIYVKYAEESEDGVLDCMIKTDGESFVEIVKKGAYDSHILLKNGAATVSPYNTPVGTIMIETVTGEMFIEEGKDYLTINVGYELNINGDHVSTCEVGIKVEE